MAGITVRMTGKKQYPLQTIHEKVHCITGAEMISKTESVINGVTIWVLVYEKYFFRTSSYTSVTVVLTEFGEEQTACVVSSGGGSGIVNLSYGTNRNFAAAFVRVLEECGLTVTESDLDARNRGFTERFLK